jgi:NAD(P)-dependent dehydrogenase (short-subunit alcohol dehydrogenase family)
MNLEIENKVALVCCSTSGLGLAVAFLSSQQAGYITGVALQVDGGYIRSIL